MKRFFESISIILFVLLGSCTQQTNGNVEFVGKRGLIQKSEIKGLKVVQEINSIKKTKLSKKENPLIKDTLIYDKAAFSNFKYGMISAKGLMRNTEITHIARTKKDSSYIYLLGIKKVNFENQEVESLTILLQKKDSIVSEINLNVRFRFMVLTRFDLLEDLKFDGIDEVINIGFGRPACGYGFFDALFFRRGNDLIKGKILFSEGETNSNYKSNIFIISANVAQNEVWVSNSEGHYEETEDVNYFSEVLKYRFEKDSLVLINPKKDDFYYVTAKSGLRQRYAPFITSDTLPLLKYGTKVNVLHETNFDFKVNENGKILKGKWVKIDFRDSEGYLFDAYIFNGYLSKEKPMTK